MPGDHSTDTATGPAAQSPEPSGAAQAARQAAQNPTSLFEFWPTWVMYFPVALMWLALAVRYRSLTLPLAANPRIPLSGMVGSSKTAIFAQAGGACAAAILPWFVHRKSATPLARQVAAVAAAARSRGIDFPFVCKPDIGCRGAGVKLVRDEEALAGALAAYPRDAGVVVQKLSRHAAEAGIFYVRDPQRERGRITSLTLKETPAVVGDGVSTVAELVRRDPRAGRLEHLYAARNRNHWHLVIPRGTTFPLLFSASHCRGAVFRDGRAHITPALSAAVDRMMRDIPEFHYGRLDVKFADLRSLEAGESMDIVEINGASAESIHIWDRDARLKDAIRTLLWQYRTLFRLGHTMRGRGAVPPPLSRLLAAWRHERRLTAVYPETD